MSTANYDFYRLIIDSVHEHICVINHLGWIVFTNKAWNEFAEKNGAVPAEHTQAINYLHVCKQAQKHGENDIDTAHNGIRDVISGRLDSFSFEYPCHSPDQRRWFTMQVTPLTLKRANYYVISHQDITQRKLAEEKNQRLARIDGLTGLANRRYFDEQLMSEWRRCARQQRPLSVALIDIDFFKEVNDNYGHAAGDYCLERVAATLEKLAHRPGDCCARFGGDEFALLLGDTPLAQAEDILASLPANVRQLHIPNMTAATGPHVTVSIGLSSMQPSPNTDENQLLAAADHFLYRAKSLGRDQLSSGHSALADRSSPVRPATTAQLRTNRPASRH